MRRYAHRQTAILLQRLSLRVNRAERDLAHRADRDLASTMTARFGTSANPLADARGSDRSPDGVPSAPGGVALNSTTSHGRRPSRAERVLTKGAERASDAGSIHDLRVALRRLSRCLRVFAQFYPCDSWKPMRRRLAELLRACGKVRDRDIAIQLAGEAGIPATSPLVRRMDEERQAAARQLLGELRRWKTSGFFPQWRARLEL